MHRFLFSTSLQKTVLRAGGWDGNKESPLSKGSRHAKIGPLTHEVLFFQIWSFGNHLKQLFMLLQFHKGSFQGLRVKSSRRRLVLHMGRSGFDAQDCIKKKKKSGV